MGGDGYACKGNYVIMNGVISFSNIVRKDSWTDHCIMTDNNGNMNFDNRYVYEPDAYNFDYLGRLRNLENSTSFWSIKIIPEYYIFEIDGIKVNRCNNEIIVIKQNLNMREKNNLNCNVISLNGCDFDFGYTTESRKVVYAGTVVSPIAKTVEKQNIDGITAPWYLIEQSEHDPFGRNEGLSKKVWIFGGYVSVFPDKEMNVLISENKALVIRSVNRAGNTFNEF